MACCYIVSAKKKKSVRLSDEIEINFQNEKNDKAYNVTPELHMSTLKPENVSSPFAISGG